MDKSSVIITRNKVKIKPLIQLILPCIIMPLLFLGNLNIRWMFFINFLIVVLIVKQAKLSIVSIGTLFLFYPMLPAYYQFNNGFSYGILQAFIYNGGNFYFKEMNLLVFLYLVAIKWFINNTDFLKKENDIFKTTPSISLFSCHICCLLSILCTVISMPTLPFIFNRDSRMDAVFVGNGWYGLALCLLIFAVYSHISDSLFVIFSIFFVSFWSLSHYERAEIAGFFIFFIFFIIKKDSKRILSLLKKPLLLGFSLVTFILLLSIEHRRGGNTFSLNKITEYIWLQVDAADIAYNFNIGLDFLFNNNKLKGISLLSYMQEITPIYNSPYRIATLIKQFYATPGGLHFFNEAIINFGMIGFLLFVPFTLLFIYKLVSIKSNIQIFWYFYILMSIPRIIWYGLIYPLTGVLWFVPLTYLMCRILDSAYKNRGRK